MIVNNGSNQITLPDIVRAGDSITAKWANSMRTAIQALRDRKPRAEIQIKIARIESPFTPTVKLNGAQWQISASRGLVIEKVSTADESVDALLYWTPSNALTDGLPTYFNINSGQSLFVKVTETNSGTVRVIASVVFEVATSSQLSLAYIPGVQDGVYYYEIAAFTVVDSKPVIERWTAASHIFHEVANGGWWGELQWNFYDLAGGGSLESHLVLTIEDGKIVNATGTNVTGNGTIASLGTGIFDSRDTDI